jgi:hypothetical protein
MAQIPEALGLASGVVFLVCIVLFQQLHHLDLPATLQHALGGRDPPPAPSQVSLCVSCRLAVTSSYGAMVSSLLQRLWTHVEIPLAGCH